MYIDVVCSWCNKYLYTKKVEEGVTDEFRISHSICAECKKLVMREYNEAIKKNASAAGKDL